MELKNNLYEKSNNAPVTYYHNSAERPFAVQNMGDDSEFEVAIIGGGFTGLGAALVLAENGVKVCLLEAEEIGYGASGRNGGLVCSGYRHDQKWFEEKVGVVAAHDLWEISEAAKICLQDIITKYQIDAQYKNGLVFAAHRPALLDWLKEDAEYMASNYTYDKFEYLDKDECAKALGTDVYYGGIKDNGAGKIHPLKLLYGIAGAAFKTGAKIYEHTRVLGVEGNIIKTEKLQIKADKILLCGDGYIEGINKKIDGKIMPIGNFVIATEPVHDEILNGAAGGMDTRFVVNYFHKTADNRLLFGGGEKYSDAMPKDIAGFVRNNLIKIYPQLGKTKIDFAWGGRVGITPTRLPFVNKVGKHTFISAGYSGQGVLLAPFFGRVLGKALLGDDKYFNSLSALKIPDFPGGRILRFPLLTAALSYYSVLDKLP
jgi:gamma-glutamylputrescine oxidase